MKRLRKIWPLLLLTLLLIGCGSKKQSLPENHARVLIMENPFEDAEESTLVFVRETRNEGIEGSLLKVIPDEGKKATMEVGDTWTLELKEGITKSIPPQAVYVSAELEKTVEQRRSAIWNMHINDYKTLMVLGDRFPLIDVREKGEFDEKHLEEAVNIPMDRLLEEVEAKYSKDTPIMVYCQSGKRSSVAAEKLEEAGYRLIIDLGGIKSYSGD